VDSRCAWFAARARLSSDEGAIVHIQLKAGLRTVWRGPGSVQIGVSTARGTVLEGLTASDARLLERLRGGIDLPLGERPRTARATRERDLIQLLHEAGVLVAIAHDQPRSTEVAGSDRLGPDAALWSVVHDGAGDGWPLLAARAQCRVVVGGAGRLGASLAAVLAAAGVGQICLVDGGQVVPADLAPGAAQRSDLGRSRQDAAADAVRRAGGHASRADSVASAVLDRDGALRTDLAVLVEYAAADAPAADPLLAADVPHLSVVIREDDVVVGPLVRPGSGPCLRCLDLHRTDRDPAWPSILAQLLGPGTAVRERRLTEECATATVAAGLAALQVLAHLDGIDQPASAGATLEIEPPDGLIARRIWPAHRSCGCHWPPRISSDRRAGPAPSERRPVRDERMEP
jgi:bacteriocin biosynthesis cyclodehydratase domain-containing protein